VLPDFLVDAPLRDGRLRRVLPEWTLRSGGVHIVYPPARFRLPKVIRFAEMLISAETRRQHSRSSEKELE
jgi:DNA-binding transcriptional LysR family regulator